MSKIVKRGSVPTDEKEFDTDSVKVLYQAGKDLCYLLNRGYKIKGASVFIGNHYMLSERQRLALIRTGLKSFPFDVETEISFRTRFQILSV